VGSLVWKRFFGERRCRFFPPPVVCIFYRPKESFPGGFCVARHLLHSRLHTR
jgi:hypothetical protein